MYSKKVYKHCIALHKPTVVLKEGNIVNRINQSRAEANEDKVASTRSTVEVKQQEEEVVVVDERDRK